MILSSLAFPIVFEWRSFYLHFALSQHIGDKIDYWQCSLPLLSCPFLLWVNGCTLEIFTITMWAFVFTLLFEVITKWVMFYMLVIDVVKMQAMFYKLLIYKTTMWVCWYMLQIGALKTWVSNRMWVSIHMSILRCKLGRILGMM